MGGTPASYFPERLDAAGAEGNLPGVANRLTFFLPIGKLLEPISSSSTRIPIANIDMSRIPIQGYVRIEDEIIAYQNLDATALLISNNERGRGFDGTTPAPHAEMSDVMWLIMSGHFAIAYDALLKLEAKVGVDNSLIQTSLDWRVRDAERQLAGAENGFLCDTFTLNAGQVANRYVEIRQAAKTGVDIMVFVEGGPSMHPGTGFFVEEADPYRVKWSPDSTLAMLLEPGDRITVAYRARAPEQE